MAQPRELCSLFPFPEGPEATVTPTYQFNPGASNLPVPFSWGQFCLTYSFYGLQLEAELWRHCGVLERAQARLKAWLCQLPIRQVT